jgi:hypothetical protein
VTAAADNPRIRPHLQLLADITFAYLIEKALEQRIDIARCPLDMFPQADIMDRWKALIADTLTPLLTPPEESP